MIHTGYKIVQLPLNTSIMAPLPYTKCYPVGEVVEADSGTLGLMIFESLTLAMRFYMANEPTSWAVLIVEYDSNNVLNTDFICRYRDCESLSLFYLDIVHPDIGTISIPPLGTICCKKLRVISELKGEPQPS